MTKYKLIALGDKFIIIDTIDKSNIKEGTACWFHDYNMLVGFSERHDNIEGLSIVVGANFQLDKLPLISNTEEELKTLYNSSWSHEYTAPLLSRKEILELIKVCFPNRSMSGEYNISASKELRRFEEGLRYLTRNKAKENYVNIEILDNKINILN